MTIKHDEDDKHAYLSVFTIILHFYTQLSQDDRVRVTDVGVSKQAVDITGTLAGTPVYIAPEVFRSETGIYEFSADIYSFGDFAVGDMVWATGLYQYQVHIFNRVFQSYCERRLSSRA